MISFIDEHRGVFGVEPICRLLPIAPSTYYENVAKRLDVDRLSIRARSDIGLKIEIRRIFEQNFRVYRAGSGNLHSGDKWNFCLTSA
jgi:putative transposase